MVDKLFLNTEGYQILFDLKTIPDRTDVFEATIRFHLDLRVGTLAFTSPPDYLTLKTLQRLVTYLEQHIAQLQANPSSESYVFVPLNSIHFQLQTLAGDVVSPDDGEFALSFMLNMGEPDEGLSSVYVGGESAISLENINRFLASINHLLAETSH